MNGRTSRVGIEAATWSHEPPSYDASCAFETRVYARVHAPAFAFTRPRARVCALSVTETTKKGETVHCTF